MFGIGGFEFFLILIFGFLIFGPDKLPEIAQTIGKAIAKFRGAQEDMKEQLKGASFIDKESDTPFNNPLEILENVASGTKSTASEVSEAASEAVSEVSDKAESFAERKARYDRERALRKQAEAEAQSSTELSAKDSSTESYAKDKSGTVASSADKPASQKAATSTQAINSNGSAPSDAKAGDEANNPKASVAQKSALEEVD